MAHSMEMRYNLRPRTSSDRSAVVENVITKQPRASERKNVGDTDVVHPTSQSMESSDDSWVNVEVSETKDMESSTCKNKEEEEEAEIQSVKLSQAEEIQRLKTDLEQAQKQIHQKDDEITRLCRHVSCQPTSDEFCSASSTPFSSMTTGNDQFSSQSRETMPKKSEQTQKCLEGDGSGFSSSSEPEYVKRLRDKVAKMDTVLEIAENRARSFQQDYQDLLSQNAALQVELNAMKSGKLCNAGEKEQVATKVECVSTKEKDRMITALQQKISELERAATKLAETQKHSKFQSEQLLDLHDEAKARDQENYELQSSLRQLEDNIAEVEDARSELARDRGRLKEELRKLEGQLLIQQAEMSKKDLEHEKSKNTVQSFSSQVKTLTAENESLRKQIVKLGQLQNEGRELSTKISELQEELRVVKEEKEQMKSTLEATQAQVLVYEEDFKTEREDRVRAFSERNEEGERYRAEIERLQTQLSSHKGNLSDLEKVHLARQRELMQALEDLKKAQEEIQAKTSQVKQYKKQHNGLVAKVASLENDNEELTGQFEVLRQKVEQASKKSKHAHHQMEVSHVREKQTRSLTEYKQKAARRKSQLTKVVAMYDELMHEVQQLRKECKKTRKKSASEVSISSPVSSSPDMDLQEHCHSLRVDKQELMEEVKVLKETNKLLHRLLGQPSDDDGDIEKSEDESHTQKDNDTSPKCIPEPDVSSLQSTRKATTDVHQQPMNNATRPRASSAFSKFSHAVSPRKPPLSSVDCSDSHLTKSLQKQHEIHVPKHAETLQQHADYVNASRVQAMLDASSQKHVPVSPTSPPTELDALPPPIMDLNELAEANMTHSGEQSQWNMRGGGIGEGGSGGAGGRNASEAEIHEAQHHLHNQMGPISLPTQQPPSVASFHRQRSVGDEPQPGPAAQHQRDVAMKEQKERVGSDKLTPGINTEVQNVVKGVLDDGAMGKVTGIPYDPNLTCVVCGKVFRIGEIQLYRNHTMTCGTLV